MPPLQLHVRATPEQVKLGEPTILEVVVSHLPDQRYELKTPGDLGDFEIIDSERSRVDGKDQSTTTLKVKLAAYQLGKLDSPQLELEVSAPEGTATLPIPRVKLDIVSSLPPDAQTKGAGIYDVKAPEELPIRSWRLLYALGAVLLGLLLGVLFYRWWNRPKPAAVEVVAPKESLSVRTIKLLDGLAAEGLPTQRAFKPYYFRLSEIVRGYLGELYDFEALESTTPELLKALEAKSTPGLPLPDLKAFAESSDFVRYAKTEPTPEQCAADLELAYRIVHSTQAAQARPAPSR